MLQPVRGRIGDREVASSLFCLQCAFRNPLFMPICSHPIPYLFLGINVMRLLLAIFPCISLCLTSAKLGRLSNIIKLGIEYSDTITEVFLFFFIFFM